MKPFKNHNPNTIISPKIVEKKQANWGHLYDEYAPMMYGIILKMADNEIIAEEIFENVFLELTERKILSPHHTPIRYCVLRHTYKLTFKYLKELGVTVKPYHDNYPLINLFYFEQITLEEAATKSDTPAQIVLKNLRAEFKHFCNNSQ
jgi:hypothetical protein